MRKTLLFLVIIYFWFLPSSQAEMKTFIHTVKQPFSGSQSPDDARTAAIHKAKREVLEKAGTYLETLSVVEDGRLTKDQILALASGVLKTEIISQEPYTTGEGFGVIVKVRVKVDTGKIEHSVKRLMNDKPAMEELVELRKKDKELLDRIERLEEVNQRLAKKKETQTVKKRKTELKKEFQLTSKELDALDLVSQAIDLYRDRKYRKTIALLDKAIKLDPGCIFVYPVRGVAYADLKQYTRAIEDFDKSIELDPGNALLYRARGKAYAALKQDTRAIQDFKKAIELDPGATGKLFVNTEPADARVRILNIKPRFYQGMDLDPGKYHVEVSAKGYKEREMWIKLASGEKKTLSITLNYGKEIQETTKKLNAVALYQQSVEVSYSNPRKAIELLDKAIELDPDYMDAYLGRGIKYRQLKQYAKAIRDFDKAIAEHAYICYRLRGSAYAALKEYTKAIQDFDKAIELEPDYGDYGLSNIYINRGEAYTALKQYARAIQDFKKAIELDPYSPEACDKIIELIPNNAWAYKSRGFAYGYGILNQSKAIQDYNKAIELDPGDEWTYISRGRAYIFLKQYARAIQDYDKAIELKPSDERAYIRRGEAYVDLKQYARAIKDFDKAIDLKPATRF